MSTRAMDMEPVQIPAGINPRQLLTTPTHYAPTPNQNQTKHCFSKYNEFFRYHPSRCSCGSPVLVSCELTVCDRSCSRVHGEEAAQCLKLKDAFQSLCPIEWVSSRAMFSEHRRIGAMHVGSVAPFADTLTWLVLTCRLRSGMSSAPTACSPGRSKKEALRDTAEQLLNAREFVARKYHCAHLRFSVSAICCEKGAEKKRRTGTALWASSRFHGGWWMEDSKYAAVLWGVQNAEERFLITGIGRQAGNSVQIERKMFGVADVVAQRKPEQRVSSVNTTERVLRAPEGTE
eukprot:2787059-Rhodomonas_salina.2